MSIDLITKFIDETPTDLASAWNYEAVLTMAGRTLPSSCMGDQEPLLKGDQYRLWLRWFLEGLVSPYRIASDASIGRLEVLELSISRINNLYSTIDLNRRKKLAEVVTDHIFQTVNHLRNVPQRDFASAATRHALLAASTPPRCYICGYAFTQEAQDAFLKVKGRAPIQFPSVLDIFRPRGLYERDVKIEIEHVVPVSSGGTGQANLRLACGWCNKHKSDRISIYEASFMAPRTHSYRIGGHQLNELPNPFWIIRMLALRGKCQHHAGCLKTAADSELFISLVDWKGSPNPTNLAIYCEDHDPIRVDRKQSRASVEKLWKERRN